MLDTDLLRTFLVIAECGNLTVAAGQLNRTQSAISVQVRKLETSLGATLFERSSRGMTLTNDGHRLLPNARAILTNIAETNALFQTPLTGALRVGLPDDFNEHILERVLARFANTHPKVNVIAMSGCTSGYPAAIKNGELDIAVCSGPENHGGEILTMENVAWAAGAGASVDPGQPIPLAVLDRTCWWQDLPAKALSAADREFTVAFRTSNFASLQAAIRAGFAVGIVPESSLCAKMRRLTTADGFPELPKARRSVWIAASAPQDLAHAMAEAIQTSCKAHP